MSSQAEEYKKLIRSRLDALLRTKEEASGAR
jgi:hypothetical protein